MGLGIIAITAALFINFFKHHPELTHQLTQLPWLVIVGLVALYIVSLLPLSLILFYTLELCGRKLPFKDLLLVTGYSAMINFFGPLQSGPVFRAVYLKARYDVSIKDYTLATLFYYGVLAAMSGMFLFLGSRWWYVALLALLIIGGVSVWYFRRQSRQGGHISFRWSSAVKLVAATLLQVVVLVVIYFIELRVISRQIHFSQAISYGGAANFSLFVALTPGAIGIRESFLLLSQQLHGIGRNTVLTASLIDRAAYVGFLLLLFAASLITHARDRFAVSRAPNLTEQQSRP